LIQLVTYIKNIVTHFDFGISYVTGEKVLGLVGERFPTSLKLGLISTLAAMVLAIPLGILAAVRQNSPFDYMSTFVAVIGSSMPGFWLALMLMLLFSVKLHWLPAAGLATWKSWVLPVICSVFFPITTMMRTTRSSVLEVIRQDYITTARSKGQTEGKIIKRHVLRNAMIPVVTVVGTSLSAGIGGSMIVETVFTIPGLGLLLMEAISNRNYPVIRGITILYAIIVCFMNLLVDVTYTFIDPRIKSQFAGSSRKKTKKVAEKEAQS
jgi:peptide/nickel transport system permease protein